MNAISVRVLIALVFVLTLDAWSAAVFVRTRTVGSVLQLLGATCLLTVVLTHVAEAAGIFPFMHWAARHSAGHYVDLCSAILGITLFSVGILMRGSRRPQRRPQRRAR